MIVWINSHESAARVRIYSNNHEWFIINIWKIVNSYLVFVFSTTREWWLMAQRCIYLLSVVFILNTTLRARINIKYNCENPPSVVLSITLHISLETATNILFIHSIPNCCTARDRETLLRLDTFWWWVLCCRTLTYLSWSW